MKLLLGLLFSASIFLSSSAQSKTNSGSLNDSISNGNITGSVTDKDSNIPLSAVSVQIVKASDNTLVSGTETGSDGKFVFENIPQGTYNIKADLVGYGSTLLKGIRISAEKNQINLDPIKLKSGSVTTDEIVIEAERSAIELKPDKKVFNVEGHMITQGGTAVDVLKNVPSVTVDVDGNISLRGSQDVRIVVDGKPFGIQNANVATILEQIPANQISSIELITNPSAKYEAEGSSGIINIVLKKGGGFGYNGSFTLNAGTKDKYNGTINFNMRNDKLKFYSSYDYRLYNYEIQGTSNRENFQSSYSQFLRQEISGRTRNTNHFVKGGLDYSINERNSLSLNSTYTDKERRRNEDNLTTQSNSANIVNEEYDLITNDITNGYNFDASLNYTLKFKNPKQLFTSDISYFKYKDNTNSNSARQYITPLTSQPPMQNQVIIDDNNETNAQMDYAHPFTENLKLEAGYKGIFKKSDKDYTTEIFDYNSNSYVNDPNQTNRFLYNEQIHAAYTQLSGTLKDFSYQLGLRAEQSNNQGDLRTTGQSFGNNYFDWFPSASLSQKLGMTEEIQASYSRRISRPSLSMLNPFVNTSDPLNYFSGNPDLKPEYIDSYELNFIKYFKTVTITPSVFYRRNTDQLSRTRTFIDSNTTLTTFNNYGTTKTYGAELIVNTTLFDFWSLSGSGSYYNTDVDAQNLQQGFVNDGYTWSGRINSTMKFPDIVDFMFSYFYSGKMIVAQGELSPFQSFDISLKKDFLDNQASISLRISDIFNNLRFNVLLDGSTFNENFYRKRDTRTAFLSFTYKFGKTDKDEKRRRGNNPDQNQGDGFGF